MVKTVQDYINKAKEKQMIWLGMYLPKKLTTTDNTLWHCKMCKKATLTSYAKLDKKHWCAHCPKGKYSLQFVINELKKKQIELLGEYKKAKDPVRLKCLKCGFDKWYNTFNQVCTAKITTGCPGEICTGKIRWTYEKAKQFVAHKGGELLSKCHEFKNSKSKIRIKCGWNKTHEWLTTIDGIRGTKNREGTWCPDCGGTKKLNIEECQKFAEAKGGKCLSTNYEGVEAKMWWKCECLYIWPATYHNIKKGHWCPRCAGNLPLGIETARKIAEERGGKCTSTIYVNNRTNLDFICENGHGFQSILDNVLNKGTWCNQCRNKSEATARKILENLLGYKLPNTRPKFLTGLELDGYNEENKFAFEYQGLQHYVHVEFFHKTEEDFITRVEYDQIKKIICDNHFIKLLEIPYIYNHAKPDEMKEFII